MANELVGGVEARVDIGEKHFCSIHGAASQLGGEFLEPSARSVRVAADELLDYACGSHSSVAPDPAVLEAMMRTRPWCAPRAAEDLVTLP